MSPFKIRETARKQALERDCYTCQICLNSVGSLEVHHKISRKKGGTDTLENLITLCHKCHKTMEPPHIGILKPKKEYTTIRVEVTTNERLKHMATNMMDTYDIIINRLIPSEFHDR